MVTQLTQQLLEAHQDIVTLIPVKPLSVLKNMQVFQKVLNQFLEFLVGIGKEIGVGQKRNKILNNLNNPHN